MYSPYQDSGTNQLYNMLFCDDAKPAATADSPQEWEKIANDPSEEPGARLSAFRKMTAAGHPVRGRELLGIIVEIGLEQGLDVLALLIWEAIQDDTLTQLSNDLFERGRKVEGATRISFLVSDGLYFGEGPTKEFNN